MNNIFSKIIELLDIYHVSYKLTSHVPVRTSEEAAAVRGVELKTGAKAMVVKAKEQYYLIVIPADRKIDWKPLKQILSTKEIRFATPEEAETVTTVKMGSVPPFGSILGLPTYYDNALLENEYINFNPGSVTHSIQMKPQDLINLVNPKIVQVTKSML